MATPVGSVGSKLNPSNNTQVDESFGPDGAQRVMDAHGRYADLAFRGRLFTAANQAAVTCGAGLSATMVTLALNNPVGSGVYLELIDAAWGFTTAAAAATTVYLAATVQSATANSAVTLVTVKNALWTGIAATGNVGIASSAATLPAAPLIARVLGSAGTSGLGPVLLKDDIGGALILMPGTTVSIQASAAAIGLGAFTWAEVPINPNYY